MTKKLQRKRPVSAMRYFFPNDDENNPAFLPMKIFLKIFVLTLKCKFTTQTTSRQTYSQLILILNKMILIRKCIIIIKKTHTF